MNITVLITSYNRPELLQRAVSSAHVQTLKPAEVIVVDDSPEAAPVGGVRYLHTGRSSKEGCFLTWYEGVYLARSPLIAILHDDDWYEPTFLERTAAMMADDVGYVFTEAMVHRPDGTTFSNWNHYWGETRHYPARVVGDKMLEVHGVISPSCVLYRRADLLRCLYPGGVPGLPVCREVTSGTDMLMALMPLLEHERIGWIADPLVNFDGHDGSTTIAEITRDGGRELYRNYQAARQFFYSMRQLRDVAYANPRSL